MRHANSQYSRAESQSPLSLDERGVGGEGHGTADHIRPENGSAITLTPTLTHKRGREYVRTGAASCVLPLVFLMLAAALSASACAGDLTYSFEPVVRRVQPKMVKIFGAGGMRRLEGYQSGLLISPEGHLITAWSYVIEEVVTVVLHDGRRLEAQLLGADPRSEVAVLKLDYQGDPLPHFDLQPQSAAQPGDRVLAFSNLYKVATGDEPVSVQHGQISLVAPIEARRGVAKLPYRGDLYLLDAMTNNPGATGGAVTDVSGKLLGMIGKEIKSASYNTWINYAIPVEGFAQSVGAILAGENLEVSPAGAEQLDDPLTLPLLGVVLVPDVLPRTPPYVDAIRSDTPAARAGLIADDLIVFVDGKLVGSCRALREALTAHHRDDPLQLTISRRGELLEVELQAPPP